MSSGIFENVLNIMIFMIAQSLQKIFRVCLEMLVLLKSQRYIHMDI